MDRSMFSYAERIQAKRAAESEKKTSRTRCKIRSTNKRRNFGTTSMKSSITLTKEGIILEKT